MKRRSFFHKTLYGILGSGMAVRAFGKTRQEEALYPFPITVSSTGNAISVYSGRISKPVKMIFLADTHLHRDDAQGNPFTEFSSRMAGAYHETRHFQSGEPTHPEAGFMGVLDYAAEKNADLLVLGGDIFSFPSEAAVEWALEKLTNIPVPYLYVAGNHDWHFEGMEGSMNQLRNKWSKKRLLPLYQDKNPLMAATDIQGIRFVVIDNSTYEINDEQLRFFRDQVQSGRPLVLACHIPLYAPGRPVSFGCGHPGWGEETDRNYEIERRPRWPESGHTQTTFDFCREVFAAPNVMGVFAGHTHRQSMDIINGKPQFVADDNASGGFLEVEFLPLAVKEDSLM